MRKIYRWLCKAEEVACGVGFAFLVAFVFLSAILRFFRFSMSWNIDLAMLFLAWTAFLGADVAWRHGQIIGVDILTRKLPPAIRRVVELIVYLIILAALIIIVIFGIKLAWTERISRYQSMPLPLALVTLSLVVASFSMVFTTLSKIRRAILAMAGKGTATVQDAAASAGLDEHSTENRTSK